MKRTMTAPDRSRLLTVVAAADRLGIQPRTLRNWLSMRKIQYVKIGRGTRIHESVIDAEIAKGTREAREPAA